MNFGSIAISFFLITALALSTPGSAAEIERPPTQYVDKFGVNMANGQVTHSLNTVSIGGAMGLSHSVSVYANEFNYPGMRGFSDKYYARARNIQLCTSPTACNPMNVMRVSDWTDTQSFSYGGPTGYQHIGDQRHTLEVSNNHLLWTKPDGTEVYFDQVAVNPPADWGGILVKVVYPNGFKIWVTRSSVNTNTGFQLKYVFDGTNAPLDKTEPPSLVAPYVDAMWPLLNPQHIYAVNSWRVRCPRTTDPCLDSLANWPFAKFEWPAGMPRTMYIGDSLVKVTDSAKRVTTYKFRAYDLAYDEFGDVVSPYVPGREFSPRLKEITPPGASAPKFTYDYKNLFALNMARLDYRLQSSGIVKSATRLGENNQYTINQDYMGSDTLNWAGAQGGVSRVHQQKMYGNPSGTYYVDTLDGRITFEISGRNFPIHFNKTAAPIEAYFYETRDNLTKVTYNNPAGEGYQILAEYPATCTNRKTCNQATRISDARNNWTDYTYYPESGLVKSITYPANKNGIRPETRFTYAWKRATYYNPVTSAIELAPEVDGLWLKATEEYCINSAASEGNCAANDEVITTYEYNHPNLLMTGMVVTSPDGVRRTCYRYDDLGNQIGVTTPNAALGICPGVTP